MSTLKIVTYTDTGEGYLSRHDLVSFLRMDAMDAGDERGYRIYRKLIRALEKVEDDQ
jgi:hypothetical protein